MSEGVFCGGCGTMQPFAPCRSCQALESQQRVAEQAGASLAQLGLDHLLQMHLTERLRPSPGDEPFFELDSEAHRLLNSTVEEYVPPVGVSASERTPYGSASLGHQQLPRRDDELGLWRREQATPELPHGEVGDETGVEAILKTLSDPIPRAIDPINPLVLDPPGYVPPGGERERNGPPLDLEASASANEAPRYCLNCAAEWPRAGYCRQCDQLLEEERQRYLGWQAATSDERVARLANEVIGIRLSAVHEVAAAWKRAKVHVLLRHVHALRGMTRTETREAVIGKHGLYDQTRKRFWVEVWHDGAASRFFLDHAFVFPGSAAGTAPVMDTFYEPDRRVGRAEGATMAEFRLSLDHVRPKAANDDWRWALDASLLEFHTCATNTRLQGHRQRTNPH